jgi:hypothetical protein
VGAPTAHEALDDNVTETEEPNNNDRITTSSYTATTELTLGTTHIEGSVLKESAAWFYTLNAKRVVVEVKNGEYTLTKATVSSPGWHSLPVALNGSQSQLDNLRLKFSGSYLGPFEVSAAFFLVRIRKPPNSIYWGARIDGEQYGSTHDAPWDYSIWDIFQEHTANKPVSTVDFGQPPPWAAEGEFKPGTMDLAFGRQAIPFETMGSEADFPSGEDVRLEDIVNDKPAVLVKLREWAQAAREYKKPFFFRWEWEMNGNWYQFGREAAENSTQFVLAWRRFHDIAEEAGATNITWVWCPNVSYPGSTPLSSLYPGDAYVDWTCIDGYNEGEGAWRSFGEVFNTTYSEILKLAPTKPIMIGETASDESAVNSKAGWITNALTSELPERFPEVRSFNWFNWNRDGHKWVIESSPAAQSAFATSISSPYYASGEFGSLPLLTPVEPLP